MLMLVFFDYTVFIIAYTLPVLIAIDQLMNCDQQTENKTLEAWLDELADRHPQHTIRLGLERMHEALKRLQMGQPQARIVTIAGTNGKGSCLMVLERLLLAEGERVGSFQSPHMSSFCERIKVGGVPTEADAIARAFDRIDAQCSDLELTFFEWNTLAALDVFSHYPLDVILLEVGLGGRLDAVNAIDNELAMITAIDYDHTDWLGDSLEAIAAEKAGVIRAHSHVISHSQLKPIIDVCQDQEVNVCYWQRDFSVNYNEAESRWCFSGVDRSGLSVSCHSPLPLGCLPDNLAIALQAWSKLGYSLDSDTAERALAELILPGRQQVVTCGKYTTLLDVAHNEAGLRALAQRVEQDFAELSAVAIIGMLADKQAVPDIVRLFPNVQHWFVLTLTGARGQLASQLADKLQLEHYTLIDDLQDWSLEALLAHHQLLIATGSFHTCDKVNTLLAEYNS